jgi:hypothetical protein
MSEMGSGQKRKSQKAAIGDREYRPLTGSKVPAFPFYGTVYDVCFTSRPADYLKSTRNEWGHYMKASSLSFRAAVIFVAAGMIWGIVMGISEDHSTMPAHAHLNLLVLPFRYLVSPPSGN